MHHPHPLPGPVDDPAPGPVDDPIPPPVHEPPEPEHKPNPYGSGLASRLGDA